MNHKEISFESLPKGKLMLCDCAMDVISKYIQSRECKQEEVRERLFRESMEGLDVVLSCAGMFPKSRGDVKFDRCSAMSTCGHGVNILKGERCGYNALWQFLNALRMRYLRKKLVMCKNGVNCCVGGSSYLQLIHTDSEGHKSQLKLRLECTFLHPNDFVIGMDGVYQPIASVGHVSALDKKLSDAVSKPQYKDGFSKIPCRFGDKCRSPKTCKYLHENIPEDVLAQGESVKTDVKEVILSEPKADINLQNKTVVSTTPCRNGKSCKYLGKCKFSHEERTPKVEQEIDEGLKLIYQSPLDKWE